MAIKRTAKRGRNLGESSSGRGGTEGRSKRTHDREPSPPPRFRSNGHRNFYESQTRRRTMIPERPLATVNSVFDSLPLTPLARGWGRFASHPSVACKNIVREFYANGRDLPGIQNLPKGESYVRGCQVIFDMHTINTLLEIPPRGEGEICYYDDMIKGNFDPDVVIRELCVQGARWTEKVNGSIKGIYRKDLKPLPTEFLHFILASMHPSKHCYEVTLERVYILYNMMTGRYMDLGRILEDEIARAIETNRALTCPSLVYKLCMQAGVPNLIEDEIIPGPMLGVKFVQRRSTAFASMPPHQLSEESDGEFRERCAAANDAPPLTTSETRILAAKERNERKLNRMIRFMRYLYKEVRSLKRHFRKMNRSPSPPNLSSSSGPEVEDAPEHGRDKEQEEGAESDGSDEGSEYNIDEDSDEYLWSRLRWSAVV